MLEMVYQLQIKIANKVVKQSTGNQLQEQLQELSFQERYHTFLAVLCWTAYYDRLETSYRNIILEIFCLDWFVETKTVVLGSPKCTY